MTESEKMDFAVQVFSALSGENQDRLVRATIDRQRMHDSISRGISPSGRRPEWIKACAIKLVDVLAEMAKEYDRGDPTDKATNADLLDVLSTTAALFRRE
jgi:NAD+--asparagine ADP-ribosyltransferase